MVSGLGAGRGKREHAHQAAVISASTVAGIGACRGCTVSRRDSRRGSSRTLAGADDRSSSQEPSARCGSVPYRHLSSSAQIVACGDVHLSVPVEVTNGDSNPRRGRSCGYEPRLRKTTAGRGPRSQVELPSRDPLVVEDPGREVARPVFSHHEVRFSIAVDVPHSQGGSEELAEGRVDDHRWVIESPGSAIGEDEDVAVPRLSDHQILRWALDKVEITSRLGAKAVDRLKGCVGSLIESLKSNARIDEAAIGIGWHDVELVNSLERGGNGEEHTCIDGAIVDRGVTA